MDARRVLLLFLVVFSTVFLAGCQAIATIFEAGIWIGIFMVLIVLLVIGFIVSRLRRVGR
jgi:hypothetical protein